jgi:hypothetical protein
VEEGSAYQNAPVIGFEGRDLNLSNVSATVDGKEFVWGGKVTNDGVHILVVTATDLAGSSTSLTRTFIIDRTPPVITIKGVSAEEYVRHPVAITYEAVDPNLRAAAATLDGTPFESGAKVGVDGDHRLLVTASDRAGNTAVMVVPFILDTTPPAIAIAGVVDGGTYEVPPMITFEVRDTHLVSATATLDGAAFTSGVTVSGEGQHILIVTANDRAGSSTTVKHTFTVAPKAAALVPKKPPVITLTGVTAGGFHLAPATITYEAYDIDLRSVEATLDGAPFTTGNTVSGEGSHTLVVTASDGAGNTSIMNVPFTVDGSAPVVVIKGVNEGETYAAPPEITFESIDASLLSISATLNGAEFVSGAKIEPGNQTLVVTATDRVGLTTTLTRTFKVAGASPGAPVPGAAR